MQPVSNQAEPANKDWQAWRLAWTNHYWKAKAGTLAANLGLGSPDALTSASPDPLNQSLEASTVTARDAADQSLINGSTLGVDLKAALVSSDLWSAAYREAVASLGENIDAAILKGENVAQVFKQLERIDKEANQESVFLRGVRYLSSLQVPLESFRLALDLAIPLTSIEPTAAMVFGVVKGVTAIAISFSTANLEFAKQIGEMLEQLSYIDDCDTLGQRTGKTDIHQALVLVYKKLLEFYNAAFDMLSRKGAKLVLKMVLENDRLPNIVKDFSKHADHLRKLVQKATWEIVEDVKAMLYDQERRPLHAMKTSWEYSDFSLVSRWLGVEKMSRQSQHHAYLQEIRVDQACEFLLTDAKFAHWHQAPGFRHLVVLGDMGCGKTVAMAFLVDELRRRSEHQLPQPRVCYHYCRNDETGGAIYVFSALILSILEQFPGLKREFFEWYKQAAACGTQPAASFKKLEEWLQATLKALNRPLFLVIEGLDESDRASRSSLLKSLRNLSQNSPTLKILLSSRPQEEMVEQLTGMAIIRLDSNAERDGFIVEKTVERQLFYLSDEVKPLVTETLSRLAQGSAIWTKMTANLIEIRGIRALGPMRAFLKQLQQPRQLSELYHDLFSRYTSNDAENQRLATTALEILAVTQRPLGILELAWAVALGVAEEQAGTLDVLAKLVDHQRLLSLVQPFIAHVDFNDLGKRQVRLLHQSVKEFIIMGWASDRPDQKGWAPAAATEQALVQQRTAVLEAGILNICIRYLLLDEVGHIHLFSREQVAIEELPQNPDVFCENDEPSDYNPCCLGNIERVCQAGSIRLHNWITQNCRPDCAIKPRFDFDSSLYDALSITSLYGSEAMLLGMLERSDFNGDSFLPNSAMGAADQILRWVLSKHAAKAGTRYST
ncbi:hypothetical protein G6O67_000119 [Ophiocordyceps sinensis]|uniref:NACHT domain-containing protein n=1 Tax=Ophiocordyceps sinensis TaxID=72228 RepID=A0A8H4V9F1_9HYPO|nr:hypothetical protein G6O67_000119 [Ophiocordyceps sinensis]